MRAVPAPIGADAPLDAVLARLTDTTDAVVPVVDDAGRYRGVLTSRGAERAATDNALDDSAGRLAALPPALSGTQSLSGALDLLNEADEDGLPVLSDDGARIVGWLTHRDVLAAYRQTVRTTAERARPDRPAIGGFRVVTVALTGSGPLVGSCVGEVDWPPNTRVMALRRDGQGMLVTADTELARGDRLTVLVPPEHANTLTDLAATAPRRDSTTPLCASRRRVAADRPDPGRHPRGQWGSR
jgi:CIC family chloride channel protein